MNVDRKSETTCFCSGRSCAAPSDPDRELRGGAVRREAALVHGDDMVHLPRRGQLTRNRRLVGARKRALPRRDDTTWLAGSTAAAGPPVWSPGCLARSREGTRCCRCLPGCRVTEGRQPLTNTTATSQNATTANRKRTTNRARPSNAASIREVLIMRPKVRSRRPGRNRPRGKLSGRSGEGCRSPLWGDSEAQITALRWLFTVTAATLTQRVRPGRRAEIAIDAVLALGSFAATLMILSHGGVGTNGESTPRVGAVAVVLAAIASLPLLAWRRAILAVLSTTMAGSVVLQALGYPGAPPIGATIALVPACRQPRRRASVDTAARRRRGRAVHAPHRRVCDLGHGRIPLVQLAIAALVWALAWFAGDRTRLRRERLSGSSELRAHTAERDAERDRRLAVAEERARIARDLHDSAAHAINVIAVQAGAARLLRAPHPARAQAALRTIEEVAGETVAEIDTIVHSLREDGPAERQVEPAPGLAAVSTLVAQHRRPVWRLRCERTGSRSR